MMRDHTEGKVALKVPIQEVASRDAEVFYNPKMAFNRDLTILLLRAWDREDLQVGLPLAGSGVRALRLLKEVPTIKSVNANDHDEQAAALMRRNAERNEVDITITQLDANKFLEQSKGFDYIDIDPFGSPNFLLDVACRRISRGGILAVTATDTGALSGAFPDAGRMKYWSENVKDAQKHELGLRILARKVMLMGMQHHKALIPILSYHQEHYYRIFFLATKGKRKAAALYSALSHEQFVCDGCGRVGSGRSCQCGGEVRVAGPCYNGPLQDRDWLQRMIEQGDDREKKFLARLLAQEIGIVGFYDTHALAQRYDLSIPKMESLIAHLRECGFRAAQAMEPTGCKTDAPLFAVLDGFTE